MSKATFEDFIKSFDDDEASELSNLNLPDDPTISKPKIEYQLALASQEWLSWFGAVDYATAPIECLGSSVKCEIAIARYAMDYLNPRDDVKDRRDDCRQIARDWKQDLFDESKNDNLPSSDDSIMSIFTI